VACHGTQCEELGSCFRARRGKKQTISFRLFGPIRCCICLNANLLILSYVLYLPLSAEVAEGDIPSKAIHELMTLSLSSHALAVAYIRDYPISLTTTDVRGNDQLGEISDLSFASGGSPPEVNHPGIPPPDGVAAAGDHVGLPRNDVAEDNADENTITRVSRDFAQGPPLHPAYNVAQMPPGAGDDGGIGSSISTFSPAELVSGSSASGGSQGKRKKSRKE
jgi:hypothetical protein